MISRGKGQSEEKDEMAGEGQDQEGLLFWECWVISLPSALTLRNEITHDVHLTSFLYLLF